MDTDNTMLHQKNLLCVFIVISLMVCIALSVGLQSRAKVPSSAVTAFNQRDDFSDFDDDDFETTNLQH